MAGARGACSIGVLKRTSKPPKEPLRGERIAALYRRACEHLALARARSYPAYLLDRLDRLTADAHQVIYQQREFGAAALWRIVSRDFPRAVRADAAYVWIATALFAVPTLVLGVLVYFEPALILSVVDAATAAQFEQMYSPSAESIGRTRDAGRRLDDVRLLHQQQHRHRVPVLRERPRGGLGQHLLSRLQRRAARRGRGLSDRARARRHVLLVRRRRTERSSSRRSSCPAPPGSSSGTRCSRRAGARAARASCTRRANASSSSTASRRC